MTYLYLLLSEIEICWVCKGLASERRRISGRHFFPPEIRLRLETSKGKDYSLLWLPIESRLSLLIVFIIIIIIYFCVGFKFKYLVGLYQTLARDLWTDRCWRIHQPIKVRGLPQNVRRILLIITTFIGNCTRWSCSTPSRRFECIERKIRKIAWGGTVCQ